MGFNYSTKFLVEMIFNSTLLLNVHAYTHIFNIYKSSLKEQFPNVSISFYLNAHGFKMNFNVHLENNQFFMKF